MEIKEILH